MNIMGALLGVAAIGIILFGSLVILGLAVGWFGNEPWIGNKSLKELGKEIKDAGAEYDRIAELNKQKRDAQREGDKYH
ncbi:hypothetical protein [Geobacter argillaceus]|uniref:hypothetical protein n=1 Tax=Geobacter argillaceus TaxID=345631 RepID=UPI00119FB8BD|nr:hypothetical protein [Geobacter argillaceus]